MRTLSSWYCALSAESLSGRSQEDHLAHSGFFENRIPLQPVLGGGGGGGGRWRIQPFRFLFYFAADGVKSFLGP